MPKILVIDDELNIRKLAEANLSASGCQVATAVNGEDGLQQARFQYPDLILLDLKLPGMSGWDVLAALKVDAKLREVPVIVMTGSVQAGQQEKALSMGAAGYLTKPFAAGELLCQVEQALEKRHDSTSDSRC